MSAQSWRGQGPGGLGHDVIQMPWATAEPEMVARALQMPGDGQPPTPEQRTSASRFGVMLASGLPASQLDRQQLQSVLDSKREWLRNYNQKPAQQNQKARA
jgi:hypothetical protein